MVKEKFFWETGTLDLAIIAIHVHRFMATACTDGTERVWDIFQHSRSYWRMGYGTWLNVESHLISTEQFDEIIWNQWGDVIWWKKQANLQLCCKAEEQ